MNDLLVSLGWDVLFEQQWRTDEEEGLAPGRVVSEHRTEYRVLTAGGEVGAELAGRLRHDAAGRDEWPAVGDWVGVRLLPEGGRGVVRRVLPRRTAFGRRAAGSRGEGQIAAANVDTVFLVSALDGDFNPRRLERYLTLAWESGAQPVVLLTKVDLCTEPEEALAAAHAIARGVPVHPLCALDGQGLEALRPYFSPGRTSALLGSSGVGKSTLVNTLVGTRLATAEVGDDGTGKHTTTHRQLFPLPPAWGGWILDTPGMRELGLRGAGAGVGRTFEDFAELFARCRFRDCRHASEPGCAVRAALADGSLDPARWEGYRKLVREEAWQARRVQVASKRQDKWRKLQSHSEPRP